MKNLFERGLYTNDYTNNSMANWAGCQAGAPFCANMFTLVHAALCAVCTFVFSILALAILRGAIGVLISVAIINIGIIGLIIIARENRIFKAKEMAALA